MKLFGASTILKHSIVESAPATQGPSAATRTSLPFFPTSLDSKPATPLRIAVLGTCIADGFAKCKDLARGNCIVDHYLMQSRAMDRPPAVDWNLYDAIVVHVTLRHVVWSASDHSHDLLHTRPLTDSQYRDALNATSGQVRNVISKVGQAVGSSKPVFYLSFTEPSSTYQGVLLNNRRKSLYHVVRTLNDEMAALLETEPNSHYLEINDLVRYHGDESISDVYLRHFTHAGFLGTNDSQKIFRSILSRVENAMQVLRAETPVKLIITDLDNTLWKGVLAEFDSIVSHHHIEGWPLAYAEGLLEFKRRGGLLAIASKNDHDATLERFGKVWGNRLTIEDFCSTRINWEPKSQNIQQILQETNLLPENVLFIDDNPREIEEVTRVFPAMRTLSGDPLLWRNAIIYSPHTQVPRISGESSNRTELMQAKQKRDQLATEMDRESYLMSLEIRVSIDASIDASDAKFARASELVNKTNQFNTTGKRWATADFDELFASGGRIITLSASDRFGDSGLVAAAIVQDREIVQVVMSCRVFGLGIESALLRGVIQRIGADSGSSPVVGRFVDTGKNRTCASFFRDHGFTLSDGDDRWISGDMPVVPAWIERLPA